jgi:hypothetical protein
VAVFLKLCFGVNKTVIFPSADFSVSAGGCAGQLSSSKQAFSSSPFDHK